LLSAIPAHGAPIWTISAVGWPATAGPRPGSPWDAPQTICSNGWP